MKSYFTHYAQLRAQDIDFQRECEAPGHVYFYGDVQPKKIINISKYDEITKLLVREARDGSYNFCRSNNAYIQSQSSSRKGT